jgi:hypothetical protein
MTRKCEILRLRVAISVCAAPEGKNGDLLCC